MSLRYKESLGIASLELPGRSEGKEAMIFDENAPEWLARLVKKYASHHDVYSITDERYKPILYKSMADEELVKVARENGCACLVTGNGRDFNGYPRVIYLPSFEQAVDRSKQTLENRYVAAGVGIVFYPFNVTGHFEEYVELFQRLNRKHKLEDYHIFRDWVSGPDYMVFCSQIHTCGLNYK
jgi:hypothetical protein